MYSQGFPIILSGPSAVKDFKKNLKVKTQFCKSVPDKVIWRVAYRDYNVASSTECSKNFVFYY